MLSPQIVGILVIALILIGVVIVAIRRRRVGNQTEATAPLDIGEPVDYTSIPYEEPTTLADRFRNAPPVVKVLAVLIPLVLLGGLIALALALGQGGGTAEVPAPPPKLTSVIERAVVAGNGKITISGTTDAANDAVITAKMFEAGQPFDWFDTAMASVNPSNGRFSLSLDRVESAPIPKRDMASEYSIVVTTSAAGQEATSEARLLEVSAPYAADFFQTVAVAPTATPKPEATPAPALTAVPAPPAELTASVRTAGRIRSQPSKDAAELGGISVGEVLTVVARTEDSSWYQVKGTEGDGWVSAALIEIKPEVAAKVSTPAPASQTTTTVFNGGNVRSGPGVSFTPPLDQINAAETVQLLGKSDDGNWYKIVNQRSVTGWVSRSLLNLTPELIAKVGPAQPDAAASSSAPTGLTATVFNGGNVRTGPGVSNGVVEQINAGETVQLLAKNAAGSWIKITTPRKTTGWVSVTLLTVDAATLAKVTVE